MSTISSSARLLRLLSLLTGRPRWSAAELAAELDVTTRTVRRDIDRLRQLDYPVESVSGPAGGYRLGGRGRRLPPLLLDEDEAVATAVCLRAGAMGSVRGVEEAATRALATLEQTLPARLRPRVQALGHATVALPRGTDTPVDPEVLLALAHGCRAAERMRFAYTARDGTRTRRLVDPHRLVHAGRRWYLVAFDVDRDAWRTLRVDRVAEPQPTGQRITDRQAPDAAELVSRSVSTAPYRHRARVRLDAPVDVVADRVPPTVAELTSDGDTTILSTGADDLTVIALHVAALGIEFTVLAPPELVDIVRGMADRLSRAAAPA